jgi:mono/diheme cytochrome c family protein
MLIGSVVAALPAAAADDLATQGEYLFRAAGCGFCHTDTDNNGPLLAGGRGLKTSFGTFYTPNITPDPETGIGRWTEADFINALRKGVSPKGRHYYPAFPYAAYTHLRNDDLHALWFYLSRQPPVSQANMPHELPWRLRWRGVVGFWKMLSFMPGVFRPQPEQTTLWNRGAYLVTAVAHCDECHTPRTSWGGLKWSQRLSGTKNIVNDMNAPNITPDKKTGIGAWSERDLADYLETGATPDGDYAGDAMADVIDNSLRYLTPEDRRAIAAYVLSLPPIDRPVQKNETPTADEMGRD